MAYIIWYVILGPELRRRWRCWRPSSGPLGVGRLREGPGEQHRRRLGGEGRPPRRGASSIDIVGTGEAWSRILWLEGASDANWRGLVPFLNASSCTVGGGAARLPRSARPLWRWTLELAGAATWRPLFGRCEPGIPEPHRRTEWRNRRFRISSRHTEGRLSAGNSRPARRARRCAAHPLRSTAASTEADGPAERMRPCLH